MNIILTMSAPVVYNVIDTGTNKYSATYMAKMVLEVIYVNKIDKEKIISVISVNVQNIVKS